LICPQCLMCRICPLCRSGRSGQFGWAAGRPAGWLRQPTSGPVGRASERAARAVARRVRRRQRPSAGHPEREFNPLSGLEQNPETATERGESATQRRRRRLPSGRRRAALEPLAAFSWRQPARAKTRRLCPRLRCQFSPRPLRARAALLLQSAGRPSSSGADNLLRLAAPRAPNAIGGAQRATRSAPARTACSCGRAGGREADRPVCGTRRPDEPAQPAAGRANFGAEREQSAPSSSPPQQDSSWIRRRRCASGLLSYPALDESVCVCGLRVSASVPVSAPAATNSH